VSVEKLTRPEEDRLGPGWAVVSWTVVATNEAADRLLAVSWHDPHTAYAASGETLWWITVLDDCLERKLGDPYRHARRTDRVDRQLLAMRHARNRIAHAFDVLEWVEPGGNPEGRAYGTPGYWKWRSLPPERRSGADEADEYQAYQRVLAGHLVQSTLTQVLRFLRAQAWRADTGRV
jgi:hypothetical protein